LAALIPPSALVKNQLPLVGICSSLPSLQCILLEGWSNNPSFFSQALLQSQSTVPSKSTPRLSPDRSSRSHHETRASSSPKSCCLSATSTATLLSKIRVRSFPKG